MTVWFFQHKITYLVSNPAPWPFIPNKMAPSPTTATSSVWVNQLTIWPRSCYQHNTAIWTRVNRANCVVINWNVIEKFLTFFLKYQNYFVIYFPWLLTSYDLSGLIKSKFLPVLLINDLKSSYSNVKVRCL